MPERTMTHGKCFPLSLCVACTGSQVHNYASLTSWVSMRELLFDKGWEYSQRAGKGWNCGYSGPLGG